MVMRLLIALQKFAVVAWTCAVVVGTLFGLVVALGGGRQKSIERNREIEAEFRKGEEAVERYRKAHPEGPFPPEYPVLELGMSLATDPMPEGIVAQFGTPPKDAYALVYWRGEWEEYYAPWAQQSTLKFEEHQFCILGHRFADAALVLGVGGLMVWFLARQWPPEPMPAHAQKGTAGRPPAPLGQGDPRG